MKPPCLLARMKPPCLLARMKTPRLFAALIPVVALLIFAAAPGHVSAENGAGASDSAAVSDGASGSEAPIEGRGTVTGSVRYLGDVARSWKAKPVEEMTDTRLALEAEPDPSSMQSPPAVEITEDGGIRKVAVWLENEHTLDEVKAADLEPIEIDQVGSVFMPQIAVVPEGSSITFLNSDSINHNVHLLSSRQEKNMMLTGGSERDVRLRYSEPMRLVCDLHAWMRASVVVVPTLHYAITDADGNFEIKNVPPGTYKLKIAHHRFQAETPELEIKIKPNETTTAEITTELGRWEN